jgi:hypothetical protein
MINKEAFLKVILKKAEKLPTGHYLDIRTYKRNRYVLLIKISPESFKIIEEGFYKKEYQAEFKNLRKILKKLLKLEFPRSHKIRIYNMGEYREDKIKNIKRKKI